MKKEFNALMNGTYFTKEFHAFKKEADFTKEILGIGATQIRKCNYAQQGIYYQSFTCLSTGLERIGKLCMILDYLINHNGALPNSNYIKEKRHDLTLLYEESQKI